MSGRCPSRRCTSCSWPGSAGRSRASSWSGSRRRRAATRSTPSRSPGPSPVADPKLTPGERLPIPETLGALVETRIAALPPADPRRAAARCRGGGAHARDPAARGSRDRRPRSMPRSRRASPPSIGAPSGSPIRCSRRRSSSPRVPANGDARTRPSPGPQRPTTPGRATWPAHRRAGTSPSPRRSSGPRWRPVTAARRSTRRLSTSVPRRSRRPATLTG